MSTNPAFIMSARDSAEYRVEPNEIRISDAHSDEPDSDWDSDSWREGSEAFDRFVRLLKDLPSLGADEDEFRQDVRDARKGLGVENDPWE